MMIPCNELNQTRTYLLQQFKKCKKLNAEDMILFVNYVYSIGLCIETDGDGFVDLDYIPAVDQGTISNTAGTNAIIPLATEQYAGLFSPEEKEILANLVVDGLIYPGIVTWSGVGFIYNVSQALIKLGGEPYLLDTDTVTLVAADPTNPRIDVVYASPTGFGVITGTPAADPIIPQVDPFNQVALTSIIVVANTTEPGDVTQVFIYRENTEWTGSSSGTGTVDYDNTDFPFAGAKAIETTNIRNAFQVILDRGSNFNLQDYDTVSFQLRLKEAITSRSVKIFVGFLNSSDEKTCEPIEINFDNILVDQYQFIALNTNLFVEELAGATRKIYLEYRNQNQNYVYDGYFIDEWQLQSGISQPNPVTEHNKLEGLQGGTPTERVHLTFAERDKIHNPVSIVHPKGGASIKEDQELSIDLNNLKDIERQISNPFETATSGTTYKVAYGNEILVRVDWGKSVQRSIDGGITWVNTYGSHSWLTVTFVDNKFILTRIGSNPIVISEDGLNWTTRSTATTGGSLNMATYGNGIYLITNFTDTLSTNNKSYYSTDDGDTWTGVDINLPNITTAIFGNDIFVAVSYDGQTAVSSDAINWNYYSAPLVNSCNSGIFAQGKFVVMRGAFNGNQTNKIAYSEDGINWTEQTYGNGDIRRWITYGDGIFLILINVFTVLISEDLINWEEVTMLPDGANLTFAAVSAVFNDEDGIHILSGGQSHNKPIVYIKTLRINYKKLRNKPLIPDPTDDNRPEWDNGTEWKGLAYRDEVVPSLETGTVISFANPQIYNSATTPATGNITNDLTGALQGVVQKIYHNHTAEPTVPAGWVLMGAGTYVESELNIIYAEFAGGTRVEYWIVNEA